VKRIQGGFQPKPTPPKARVRELAALPSPIGSSPGHQTVNKTPRSFPSPGRSIDSTESECTVRTILRSPLIPLSPDDEHIPICRNVYNIKLHQGRGGCQVCIFKLSEVEKDQYETNGRHLRVVQAVGGCLDCRVFPSEEGEDPVRLCKQCFFDTHLIAAHREEAFAGNGALPGMQHNRLSYSPGRKTFMNRKR
jgi:hypothetical protein